MIYESYNVIAVCDMATVHRQNFSSSLEYFTFPPQDLSPNQRKSTSITNWRITFQLIAEYSPHLHNIPE